jgi:hypothetical protein
VSDPEKLDYATPATNKNTPQQTSHPILGAAGCSVYGLLTLFTALVLMSPCGYRDWKAWQLLLMLALIAVFGWRAIASFKATGIGKLGSQYNEYDEAFPDDKDEERFKD